MSVVYNCITFLGFTYDEAKEIYPQIPKESGTGHILVSVGEEKFYVYVIIKCCRVVEQAKDSARNPTRTAEKKEIPFFQNWLPDCKLGR